MHQDGLPLNRCCDRTDDVIYHNGTHNGLRYNNAHTTHNISMGTNPAGNPPPFELAATTPVSTSCRPPHPIQCGISDTNPGPHRTTCTIACGKRECHPPPHTDLQHMGSHPIPHVCDGANRRLTTIHGAAAHLAIASSPRSTDDPPTKIHRYTTQHVTSDTPT